MQKPYKKKKAVRPRKKRYTKRRSKTTLVNKSLQPFPDRYIAKLKYIDTFSLSTVNVPYRFNLNSIFDPNNTGIGHQPYGRDTLAQLYNRYRVFACKVRIRGQPLDGSNQYIVSIPSNDIITVSSFTDAREKPMAKYVVQTQGGDSRSILHKINIPRLMGRTSAQYKADDRYQADMGSDPAENASLSIYSYNCGSLSTSCTTLCTIELTYYVECFDRNTLSQS